MIEIIPAIMSENLGDIRGKLSMIRGGIIRTIQIDLCDGIYVPRTTWPYNDTDTQGLTKILNEEEGLPFWEEFDYEFDLMVKDAKDKMGTYLQMGAKRLIFHVGAEDQEDGAFRDFLEGIDMAVRDNVEIGIAIGTTTDIEKVVAPLIPFVDFVQCMGIDKIGFQSQPFDPRVYDQIKKIKKLFPDMTVSVDGSVNMDTAHDLIEAGADRLVMGSAIWKAVDVRETITNFQNLVI